MANDPSRPASLTNRTRQVERSRLLRLPDTILDRILLLSTDQQPLPSAFSTLLLLVCHRFRDRGSRLFFEAIQLGSPLTTRRFALQLDEEFVRRTEDYSNTYTNLFATAPSSLYPIHPNTLFNRLGPRFRLDVRELKLVAKWDVSGPLLPNWAIGRGVPFGCLPVLLDIVRLRLPNLRRLTLDLPKSLVSVHPAQANIVALDTFTGLGKFGMLQDLIIDGWELHDTAISPIFERCSSLQLLIILRLQLTLLSFAPVFTSPRFALTLRHLILSELTLAVAALPLLLKSCLNLTSLQLVGFTFREPVPVNALLEAFNPQRRRFPTSPPIAPIRSLVLRLSYRAPADDFHVVILASLFYFLSATLRNLHLGLQHSESIYILLLLCGPVCPQLDRLWLGFMNASQEVGDKVRLSVADDKRTRSNIIRGERTLSNPDPLDVLGQRDDRGRAAALSDAERLEGQRVGGLSNEKVVLGRISLDEVLVRALVDPSFAIAWPPIRLSVYHRLAHLLRPSPSALLSTTANKRLSECHVFETEYVGAMMRQQEILNGTRVPTCTEDGQGGRGGVDGWARIMNGNQGRNR